MSAGALILLLAALALCTRAAAPMVSRTDVAAAQCAAAGFLAAVNQTGFRIRPLWMHAPKTGSAFATTLIQGQPECAQLAFDGPILEPSVKLKRAAKLNQSQCVDSFIRMQSGHEGLGVVQPHIYPHAVLMLRRPKERVASGLLKCFHSCISMSDYWQRFVHLPPGQECGGQAFAESVVKNVTLILKYARCVHGQITAMINGVGAGLAVQYSPLTSQMKFALQVIDKVGFVGLAEHWNTSVCLYRAMYTGTPMDIHVFGKSRVNPLRHLEQDIVKTLEQHDWFDRADEAVYKAGMARFHRDVTQYLLVGVSKNTS